MRSRDPASSSSTRPVGVKAFCEVTTENNSFVTVPAVNKLPGGAVVEPDGIVAISLGRDVVENGVAVFVVEAHVRPPSVEETISFRPCTDVHICAGVADGTGFKASLFHNAITRKHPVCEHHVVYLVCIDGQVVVNFRSTIFDIP